MFVTVKVGCTPVGDNVQRIRTLACTLARDSFTPGYNAMTETIFNELLDAVVQEAFDAGRDHEQQGKAK